VAGSMSCLTATCVYTSLHLMLCYFSGDIVDRTLPEAKQRLCGSGVTSIESTDSNGGSLSVVEAMLLKHCSLAVFTMGSQGARAVSSTGERVTMPACRVLAVDTVGAGDYFCGAFLAAYIADASLGKCIGAGCAAGSQVVQSQGARLTPEGWIHLRSTLDSLMAAHSDT
jgi:sugar/nucleoside kinase (ribokinase family)